MLVTTLKRKWSSYKKHGELWRRWVTSCLFHLPLTRLLTTSGFTRDCITGLIYVIM
jgi:hypothetical protein